MEDDLKQYITNLLYYAHIESLSMSSDEFDKWVEEHIDLLNQYFIENETTH